MNKKSVTGLITQQHEVHRLENLFYKKKESAYYLPDYGLDWDVFLSKRLEISTKSFLNYLIQEATKHGIIISKITHKMQDFTLNIQAVLLAEDTVYLTSNVGF